MTYCTRTRPAFDINRQQIQPSHAARSGVRTWNTVARSFTVLVIGACALAAAPAHALTLCASSSQSLQSALFVAQVANEAVTIRIASGTYSVPGLSAAFPAPTTLLGGYDAACNTRPANVKASDTILDFGGYGVNIAQTTGRPVSSFATDGLSLLNASNLSIWAGDWGEEGHINLTRTHVTGVPSGMNPIALNVAGGGSVRLDNVLMDKLPSGMPSGACAFAPDLLEGGTILLQNTTIALPSNKTMCLKISNGGGGTATLNNSIIWSDIQTSAIDSFMDTVNTAYSTYFALNRHGGNGQDVVALHDNPQWANSSAGDYHLTSSSTSVNSGTPSVPGGLSAFDLDGKTRWQGQLPDRGAYESPYQSAQTYTVTTTADSGTGSLRDAITKANQDPNLGIINFAMPGACPRVIALNTMLPKVTTPMQIDGTSQPGWVANTDDDAFLATLCVVVMPASGSLAAAFNVPANADASLTLRGVAMGGFLQPVFLAGGDGHVLAGNRFGGILGNGLNLVGALANSISVAPTLDNGSFIIGGPSPADRNLISKSTLSGINVQAGVDGSQDHCQIVNNLIGTSANGNTAAPNYNGITMSGNHCRIDSNRIVGNTTDGIVVNNAFETLIQRNIIGLTVDGNGLQNSGVGIRFAGSPSYNVIGAPLSTYAWGLRNTIRFMANGGIVIPSGVQNVIRSNEIRDNGIGGDGLDIDLDADGPTANDIDVAQAPHANLGQNFPLISQVAIPAGTPSNATNVSATLTAKLDSLPGTYRMDAYFTNHCSSANGRGHADAYLGGTTATALQVFNFVVTLPNVLSTGFVSFTATNQAGNTSEMGICYPVSGGGDTIFANSFED
ncbi:MAG: right-handed parallel beta-helix repeat-containing protein [Dokdonella sp.]